ncbi:hypothetical protein K3495_g2204 [Podosphaera aphanis]|nr:hypothetical protein K3495_g2204 [Podosphaera aphanis]
MLLSFLCRSRPPLKRTIVPAVRPWSPVRQVNSMPIKQPSSTFKLRWRTSLVFCSIGFGYFYFTDTRATVHQWLVVPMISWLYPDAEDAHHAGTNILKTLYSFGLHPRERTGYPLSEKEQDLSVSVFGQKLQCPIGTSAGIDKLAEIPDALFALGAAIVEVGGATPSAQEGNPKPRVFRLPNHNALINRYGLNGKGADDMARRLHERVQRFAYRNGYGLGEEAEQRVLNGDAGVPPGSLVEGKFLAVQIAKSKETDENDIEAVKRDYVECVEKLARYADILVVNVSSPNTPGLRTLQSVEPLTKILQGVVTAAHSVPRKTAPRVMVKVSPDEDKDEQVKGIVQAIWSSGVDGVIVGNTTKRRCNVLPEGVTITSNEQKILDESGGFSGPMMFERTLGLVKRYKALLDKGPPSDENSKISPDQRNPQEAKVIFATGGITNGHQALQILNAGASVAQIYTAMVYGGAGTITRIKKEMKEEMRVA